MATDDFEPTTALHTEIPALADPGLAVTNGRNPGHGSIRGELTEWQVPGRASTAQRAVQ